MGNIYESRPTQSDVLHEAIRYKLPLSAKELGEQLAQADSNEARETLARQMVD